ncbi:hypothetical protein [Conservatibacter flavescens]|uniref:DUF3108 domain-containing protein n=1 Tax=Conservatibacter flavescens TaxID=28161 RepID=A0A2M8S4T9_9PAST|nr:hypothetical protein [Conservatibacter flavescens]PJG86160.1 hypothetical protein CVP05_03030 [Conservatibacter flavescens]
MKLIKVLILGLLSYLPTAWAASENFNIKYSSNYLMPAYVHFKSADSQYTITANINVPLYKIQFTTQGYQRNNQFNMLSYRDSRNGKDYATARIDMNTIQYGKVKEQKTETFTLPTFDLFSVAFQLSYYDKLPANFQITNGKKLYPMKNVRLQTSRKTLSNGIEEITYKFSTGDKDMMVKKHKGEKFPRFISYSRDGDDYELTFSEFVK